MEMIIDYIVTEKEFPLMMQMNKNIRERFVDYLNLKWSNIGEEYLDDNPAWITYQNGVFLSKNQINIMDYNKQRVYTLADFQTGREKGVRSFHHFYSADTNTKNAFNLRWTKYRCNIEYNLKQFIEQVLMLIESIISGNGKFIPEPVHSFLELTYERIINEKQLEIFELKEEMTAKDGPIQKSGSKNSQFHFLQPQRNNPRKVRRFRRMDRHIQGRKSIIPWTPDESLTLHTPITEWVKSWTGKADENPKTANLKSVEHGKNELDERTETVSDRKQETGEQSRHEIRFKSELEVKQAEMDDPRKKICDVNEQSEQIDAEIKHHSLFDEMKEGREQIRDEEVEGRLQLMNEQTRMLNDQKEREHNEKVDSMRMEKDSETKQMYSQLESERHRFTNRANELTSLRKKVDKLETQKNEIGKGMTLKDQAILDLRTQLRELNLLMNQERNEHDQSLAQLRNEITQLKSGVAERDDEIKQIKKNFEDEKKQMQQDSLIKEDRLRAEIAEMNEILKNQLDESEKYGIELKNELSQKNSEIVRMQGELTDMGVLLQNKEEEIKSLKSQNGEMKKGLGVMRMEMEEGTQRTSISVEQSEERRRIMEAYSKERERVEMGELNGKLAKRDSVIEELKEQIEDQKQQMQMVIEENTRTEAESAEQERGQRIQAEESDQRVQLMHELNASESSALMIQAQSEHESQLQIRSDRIENLQLMDESEDEKQLIKDEELGERLRLMDEWMRMQIDQKEKEHKKEMNTQLESERQKSREKTNELFALQSRITDLGSKLDENEQLRNLFAESKRDRLMSDEQDTRQRIHGEESEERVRLMDEHRRMQLDEINQLREQLSEKNELILGLQREMTSLKSANENSLLRSKEMDDRGSVEMEESDNRLKMVEDMAKQVLSERDDLVRELAGERENGKDKMREIRDKDAVIQGLEDHLRSVRNENEQLRSDLKSADDQRARMSESQMESEQNILDLTQRIAELERGRDQSRVMLADKDGLIRQLRSQKADLMESQRHTQREWESDQRRLQQTESEVRSLNSMLLSKEDVIVQLRSQLADQEQSTQQSTLDERMKPRVRSKQEIRQSTDALMRESKKGRETERSEQITPLISGDTADWLLYSLPTVLLITSLTLILAHFLRVQQRHPREHREEWLLLSQATRVLSKTQLTQLALEHGMLD